MTDNPGYNRRRFLSSLGLATTVSLTGCTGLPGGSEEPSEATTTPREQETSSPTEQDTTTDQVPSSSTEQETTTETQLPTVQALDSEVLTDPRGRKWVRAGFENTSDVDHGRLHVTHSVYDGEGQVVDSQEAIIDLLPAGETWRDYRFVFGERSDEAETAEAKVLTDSGKRADSELEGINVVNSTLHKDYQSDTEIVGEVENTGSERSIYVTGLMYTEGGLVRGSVGTYLTDVEPGETRAFRAGSVGQWTPRNREDELPTEHDVYAFSSRP